MTKPTIPCRQVGPTQCRCGQSFASLYLLEVHVHGEFFAEVALGERRDALQAIHATTDGLVEP
jgi:hypothetical protein